MAPSQLKQHQPAARTVSASSSHHSDDKLCCFQQLDVFDLDDYIYSLFQIDDLFRYFRQTSHIYRWLEWLKPVILPSLTILWTRGQTPGAKALNLQLSSTLDTSRPHHHNMSNMQQQPFVASLQILLHLFLSVGIPNFYDKLQRSWWQRQSPDSSITAAHGSEFLGRDVPTNTSLERRARQRKQHVIRLLFHTIDTILPLIRLGLLLSIWRSLSDPNSKSQVLPPSLSLLISGLRYYPLPNPINASTSTPERNDPNLAATSISPLLNVLFGHRRWLQQETTRFFPLLITPLLHSSQETQTLIHEYCARY